MGQKMLDDAIITFNDAKHLINLQKSMRVLNIEMTDYIAAYNIAWTVINLKTACFGNKPLWC